MNALVRIAVLAGVILLAGVATSAQAQGGRWRGPQGWGPGGPYARLYDPATVEEVTGKVIEVRKTTPMRGMSAGVALVVKTSADQVVVHLGPEWFLENQEPSLGEGDAVVVEGSRVTLDGAKVVLAASVRKGDQLLQLRDPAGVPRWAGWRRAP